MNNASSKSKQSSHSCSFVLLSMIIGILLCIQLPNLFQMDHYYDALPPIYQNDSVTALLLGEAGAGKSDFGNTYLRKKAFQCGDSDKPVTLDPAFNSSKINGFYRYVIDTEGLNDGVSTNSKHIARLGQFIRDYPLKIHSVALVINGQNDRFTQNVQDFISYIYNSFKKEHILNNFCIVFSKCYNIPNHPNYPQQKAYFMKLVRLYLSNITHLPLEQIPEIPAFYIDTKDRNKYQYGDTYLNLYDFHKWTCSRSPLNNKNFVDAAFQEERVKEEEYDIYTGSIIRDNIKYSIYVNRTRYKIIPNNGEPAQYTNWGIDSSRHVPIEKYIMSTTIREEIIEENGKCYCVKTITPTRTTIDLKSNVPSTAELSDQASVQKTECSC